MVIKVGSETESSVCIMTGLWARRPGFDHRLGENSSFFPGVQMGSGAHSASYLMDTGGSFPRRSAQTEAIWPTRRPRPRPTVSCSVSLLSLKVISNKVTSKRQNYNGQYEANDNKRHISSLITDVTKRCTLLLTGSVLI
jgi:hypothetical protein